MHACTHAGRSLLQPRPCLMMMEAHQKDTWFIYCHSPRLCRPQLAARMLLVLTKPHACSRSLQACISSKRGRAAGTAALYLEGDLGGGLLEEVGPVHVARAVRVDVAAVADGTQLHMHMPHRTSTSAPTPTCTCIHTCMYVCKAGTARACVRQAAGSSNILTALERAIPQQQPHMRVGHACMHAYGPPYLPAVSCGTW